MKHTTEASIVLGGRVVDYRVVRSKTARKLRVRVGPGGVEVVWPASRESGEVAGFLSANGDWIAGQLERVKKLRELRQLERRNRAEILFRGKPTSVRVEIDPLRRAANRVTLEGGDIVVRCGPTTNEPAASLENWLRREAGKEIRCHLDKVASRLKRVPRKVYVMGQRTKWGNCSAMHNLSFNWRLILAPDFVLRYLVTHEAAHLAVPDHSRRFWLTVQSLCPEMERAKQWLSANGESLFVNLVRVCSVQGSIR